MNSCYYVTRLLLFMVSFVVGTTTSTATNCSQNSSCGNQVIRFPFRIKNQQPPSCCYPCFDLICSSNQTMIQLPQKVKLNVDNIDYKRQTIQLSDPQTCLSKQIKNLNLSSTQFNYLKRDYDDFMSITFSIVQI